MTHYEVRLQEDLDALRDTVVALASDVRTNLADAIESLLAQDRERAYRTILADNPINRSTERVEAMGHRFIARHLPSAGHLRFVTSVLRIAIILERMGDYAVTVCRETVQLREPLSGAFLREVRTMAEDSLAMFDRAIRAFRERDEALARGTMKEAEKVDRDFLIAFNMLLESDPDQFPLAETFGRLITIMQLERVSDQAKNLCEETVFALCGETKKRRPVRILVVGPSDDGDTQIAAAIGRKDHARSGTFSSAGLAPVTSIREDVRGFLEAHGFDLATIRPRAIADVAAQWDQFDVIVSLAGPVTAFLDPVPFHTVALSWDTPAERASLEDRYRFLATEIGDLMEVLRGPNSAA